MNGQSENESANVITCRMCGGSGFFGNSSGYDGVCPECGGQRAYIEAEDVTLDDALSIDLDDRAASDLDIIETAAGKWLEHLRSLRCPNPPVSS